MKKTFFGIACVVSFFAFFNFAKAATRTASSCNFYDVQSAYNSASTGDTVQIPSGTCAWSSQLTISKAITIQGAGMNSTIIRVGTDAPFSIVLPSDVGVRITGIYFLANDSGSTAIRMRPSVYGNLLTKLRVDHCKFENGSRVVNVRGDTYGVIDHNQFTNNNIAIGFEGNNDASWALPIVAGTANAMFIEDNVFTINNNALREPNELIYHQEGARSVTRYNVFDASAYTAGDAMFFDSHGQWTPPYRGQPILEIYKNTFKCFKSYRPINIRGGSVLIHSNTFMGDSDISLHLDNEQTENWPQPDQIYNSFIWGNTNANPYFPNSSSVIKENRDYFLHAPASSGGKETLINNGLGGMTFSSSGANAYYPYTPYTYPHPLSSGSTPPPACTPSWQCTSWSTCVNSTQTRTCTDSNNCGVNTGKPATTQSCTSAKTADLNGDKKVDIFDYTIFAQNFGKTGSNIADLNLDSKVDIFDYTIFAGEFGK